MHRLCLIPLLMVISACQMLQTGGATRSDASGLAGAWSEQAVIATGIHRVLIGEARILAQGDNRIFLLQIGQRWDGVARPISVQSLWQGTRALAFAPPARRGWFCVGGGDCLGHDLGAIILDADAFDAARTQGLHAQLIGTNVTIALFAPPHLFADAQANAISAGLL